MAGMYFQVGADFSNLRKLKKEIDDLRTRLLGMDRAADPMLFRQLEMRLQRLQVQFNNEAIAAQRAAEMMQRSGEAARGATSDFDRLKATLAKIGGVTAFAGLVRETINVRSEFQQLEIAFTTMLKSGEKAQNLINGLKDFASSTPFGLSSASSAAKQLIAYGSQAENVIKELTMLGDVAAGTGQQIGDLVYLYGTLRMQGRAYQMDINQFAGRGIPIYKELANVLKINENQVRDFVSSGKVGFKEVEQAFINMTSSGSMYGGLMQAQSKALAGQIEELKDNISFMFNEIGKSSEDTIGTVIGGLSTLVENYEKVGKIIVGLIATYGAYRTAVILNTIAESGWTVAQMAQYKWLLLVEKAQRLVNATMLANPYVLATTVLVGLTASVWALYDGTTSQESAQERLNKVFDDAKQKKENLENESSQLIGIINSETKSILDQIIAYKDLQGMFPSILKNMDMQTFKSKSLKEQQLLINQALNDMQFKSLDTEISNSKNKIDEYNKSLEKTSSSANYKGIRQDLMRLIQAEEYHLDGLQKQKDEISKLQKEAEFRSLPEKEQLKILKDQLSSLEQQKTKIEEITDKAIGLGTPFERLTLSVRNAFLELTGISSEITRIQGLISTITGGDNPQNKNEAFYQKQKKDAETALKAMNLSQKGSEDWTKQLNLLNDANKNLKIWDFSGKAASTAEKTAQKQIEAQRWLVNKQRELNLEQIKSVLESEQKILDLREDSFDKQSKQNELNYRKELLSIKEYEAKKVKEQQEAAKQLYTKEKGSDTGFNFATFDLSKLSTGLRPEDIAFQVKELTNAAKSSFEKSNKDLFKQLTEQYQSYTDERVAIEKKFNSDIEALIKLREKAQQDGNANQVDQLSRSISKATVERGKSLMSLDLNQLKQSPEYIRAFEDLKNTSSETLNSLLNQLEESKQAAAAVLSPDQLREYTTTIQSIIDELTERDPFEALRNQRKDLADAAKLLTSAENDLNKVRSGNKVIKSLSVENGKLVASYLDEVDAVKKVNSAKDNYNKKNNTVTKSQAKVNDLVLKLSDSLSNLGTTIGGTAGDILNLMGDFTTFTMTSLEGIEKLSVKSATALQMVEKASVILGIISTAIQLLQKLDSLLPDSYDQYEKYAAKVAEINKMRDAVNEYELAVQKAREAEDLWFSEDGLRNLKYYKEYQDKVWDAYIDKLTESQAIYQNKGGGGWLTGSLKFGLLGLSDALLGTNILGNKYKEGQTAAINNLRIETRRRSSGFLGSGIGGNSQGTEDLVTWIKNQDEFKEMGDLFDEGGLINLELAEAVLNQFGDKLVGQTKETLEQLVELRKEYDEFLTQLRDYVSSLYEPLVSNMVDSLWDWLDSGKDALDSFKDYASDTFRDIVTDMMQTIVLSDVFGTFKDDIADYYEQYAKGDINLKELTSLIADRTNQLTTDYETNLPAIQESLKTITDIIEANTGIDITGASSAAQSASKGGYETMSQDTASALEGRFTALQMSGINIERYNLEISSDVKTLMSYTLEISGTLREQLEVQEEMRALVLDSFYQLRDINTNTRELYQINSRIGEMNQKLERL